jgi:hypothetical protein
MMSLQEIARASASAFAKLEGRCLGLYRTPAHGLASSFFGFAARCVRPERRSNGILGGGNAAAAFITLAPNSGPYARAVVRHFQERIWAVPA